jgi:hypothetical protein
MQTVRKRVLLKLKRSILFAGLLRVCLAFATIMIYARLSWHVNKFLSCQGTPHFCGRERFVTLFTKAHNWTLCSSNSIQSTFSLISVQVRIFLVSIPVCNKWSFPHRLSMHLPCVYCISCPSYSWFNQDNNIG